MKASLFGALRNLDLVEHQLRRLEESCLIVKEGESVIRSGEVMKYMMLCHARDEVYAAIHLLKIVKRLMEAEG